MDEVPTRVREIVRQREAGADGTVPRCLRCGGKGSEYAHRRTRSEHSVHRHCPCNGMYLCHTCHQVWAHHQPAAAMAEGFMVSRFEAEPGKVPVKSWYGWIYLLCDGDIRFHVR